MFAKGGLEDAGTCRYDGHNQLNEPQVLSRRLAYTDRLADVGIAPSVRSRGDSYDNALAESVIGLYKTEVIQRRGPWRHPEAVEFATLEWVDWFNKPAIARAYRLRSRETGTIHSRSEG